MRTTFVRKIFFYLVPPGEFYYIPLSIKKPDHFFADNANVLSNK